MGEMAQKCDLLRVVPHLVQQGLALVVAEGQVALGAERNPVDVVRRRLLRRPVGEHGHRRHVDHTSSQTLHCSARGQESRA